MRVIKRRSCLCAAMIYAVLITSHTHIMFLDAHKVHGDSHRPFFVSAASCRLLGNDHANQQIKCSAGTSLQGEESLANATRTQLHEFGCLLERRKHVHNITICWLVGWLEWGEDVC